MKERMNEYHLSKSTVVIKSQASFIFTLVIEDNRTHSVRNYSFSFMFY